MDQVHSDRQRTERSTMFISYIISLTRHAALSPPLSTVPTQSVATMNNGDDDGPPSLFNDLRVDRTTFDPETVFFWLEPHASIDLLLS